MPKSIRFNRCRTAAIFFVAACSLAHAPAALALEGLDLSGVYIAELAITPAGGTDSKVRYLDNLGLTLDADLAPLLGISNTTVRINVISNAGAQPSESAPTLEGFHNIEVARDAVRLFEAGRSIPSATVRSSWVCTILTASSIIPNPRPCCSPRPSALARK